ncbi:PilN domain-containing protein [Shewanella sp. Scap07]|uniref:PilN domain-containing protein n=1 Tax=Shewanella sp. Scap07 TaxID=2589987 RepID=UPI0015BA31F3|nr:PilN domain-containing protein [Shewanella sp. Scap07]QLE87092.1 PilN domain-containing protein [Shewanella sp. Scap07]
MSQKLRVNLFDKSLLPKQLRLSFQRLAVGSGALLLLFVVAIALAWQSVNSLQADKAQLTSTKRQFDQQKQQLEMQLAARKPDAKLVDTVELKGQQLELKRLLLKELSQREALTSQGYSLLLTDLARVADNSIWLSRIRVNEDKYVFEGFSVDPNGVPQWVERLRTTETLKGHAFAAMTMSRGEGQPLGFTLTSDATEEPQP